MLVLVLFFVLIICLFFIAIYYLYYYQKNNYIDHVLYINLAHRTDRKQQIENELCNKNLNYTRIDAIYNKDNGHKGCCASHIKALKYAKEKNYKSVLILEDDFTFTVDKMQFDNTLNTIFSKINNNYDVIMFSGNKCGEYIDTDINILKKVTCATTTSAYLINNTFYDKLIQNFEESYANLKDILDNTKNDNYAIDQNWIKLQSVSKWYIIQPCIGKQRESYSDIMEGVVNYNL